MAKELSGIARRLREMRDRVGLSQSQLAERAGLNVSQVTNIEQGRTSDPRLSTLRALAGALGCSVDELIGEEG